jgi:hypothetical protein
MIIFDTSKFHKPLDNEWLDGLYICLNLISNWFIFQEKRTYKPTHYREDWIYAHKEQTKDVVVLPEHLFVNLIDMELQKEIANAKT